MKGVFGFILGTVVGGAAVYVYLKNKFEAEYNEKIDEAIKSVERVASEKKAEEKTEEEHLPSAEEMVEYAKKLSEERYSASPIQTEDDEPVGEPYVIGKSYTDIFETDEKVLWPTKSLFAYTDGVVMNDDNSIIPTPESMLGVNFLDELKSSEEGVVYIANPNLKTIYEVENLGGPYNDNFDTNDDEEDEESYWEK